MVDYGHGAVSFVMPNLLSKLGAEVLAINPFASTSAAAAFDREHNSSVVGDLVTASGRGSA
ncbi:MAG: hypothetical protein R2695_16480 [Acidimicrobiales bacterium]